MSKIDLPRTVGDRPYRVRVYLDRGLVRCEWWVKSERKRWPKKGLPDSPHNRARALAWAKDYAAEARRIGLDQRGRDAGPLSLHGLWEKYQEALGGSWRPKTKHVYAEYQAHLEDRFGPDFQVGKLTHDDLDAYKNAQRAAGYAHGQIRRQIGHLRSMVSLAVARGWIQRNGAAGYLYKVAKEERPEPVPEYQRAELVAIAAELQKPMLWRVRCFVAIAGSLGPRPNALLHVTWPDVDFAKDRVWWAPEWDKLGKGRWQPLTARARAAFLEAQEQAREGQRWVFWAAHKKRRARGEPTDYETIRTQLVKAERRAGVAHRDGRALHGPRRTVINDIPSLADAADFVGQQSIKVAGGYTRERVERMERARDAIDQIEAAPKPTPTPKRRAKTDA